jgi:hypothetical protein
MTIYKYNPLIGLPIHVYNPATPDAPHTPLANLALTIAYHVGLHGYILSRHGTAKSSPPYKDLVQWTIHAPPRTRFSRDLRYIVTYTRFFNLEGKSRRCKAWIKLSAMYSHYQQLYQRGLVQDLGSHLLGMDGDVIRIKYYNPLFSVERCISHDTS